MTHEERRKLTVKNVKRYIRGHDREYMVAMQQTLEWFGVARKLERIVWALLEKHQRQITEQAIRAAQPPYADLPQTTPEDTVTGERTEAHDKEAVQKAKTELKKRRKSQGFNPGPPPLSQVVDFCPKCNSPVYGEPQRSCKKRTNEPVFYKECGSCSWWAEIWRYRNKYKTVEEGG